MNTQEPGVGYAFWTAPGASAKVVYSLDLFQEIDAVVNEGYRSIPRGGIETGGVLFGTRDAGEIRIEAFRSIFCQHAFGPSFTLSESDLDALELQLKSAAGDPDLDGYQPLGWFVGHTRTPLQVSERELAWFNRFFPERGSVFLLIKPERFQPTRFGFLVRSGSGELPLDASQTAIILPLSGAVSRSEFSPSPSIPAPKEETPVISAPVDSAAPSQPKPSQPNVDREETEAPSPIPPAYPSRGAVTRVRGQDAPMPLSAEPLAVASSLESSTPGSTVPPVERNATQEPAVVSRPLGRPPAASIPPQYARLETESSFGFKSIAVLVLAAVLGCAAGYWAYLQLPSPVIPVSVHEQGGQFVVEWPSKLTDQVDYAALQINDGQWMTLSSAQKENGRAAVPVPPGDLKIDLVAKHWLRDSRGIVRYIRTARPSPSGSASPAH